MAICLGGKVVSVTIEPDDDDGPQRYGDTLVHWRSDRSERQLLQFEILVLLAGPVAEMIYRGEPLHPGFVPEWADDWRKAWERAVTIHPAPRQRLHQLEQLLRQLHQTLSNDDHWAALAAIADELLAHETLEHESVEAIVRQWIG